MPPILCYQASFKPGDESWHPCEAPTGDNAVVFEDDGETAYLYACGGGVSGSILDAVHIYDVAKVNDRHTPSVVQVEWSPDGDMAALLVNGTVFAVVDFSKKRSCCRTGFPPTSSAFASKHDWDEALLKAFQAK